MGEKIVKEVNNTRYEIENHVNKIEDMESSDPHTIISVVNSLDGEFLYNKVFGNIITLAEVLSQWDDPLINLNPHFPIGSEEDKMRINMEDGGFVKIMSVSPIRLEFNSANQIFINSYFEIPKKEKDFDDEENKDDIINEKDGNLEDSVEYEEPRYVADIFIMQACIVQNYTDGGREIFFFKECVPDEVAVLTLPD